MAVTLHAASPCQWSIADRSHDEEIDTMDRDGEFDSSSVDLLCSTGHGVPATPQPMFLPLPRPAPVESPCPSGALFAPAPPDGTEAASAASSPRSVAENAPSLVDHTQPAHTSERGYCGAQAVAEGPYAAMHFDENRLMMLTPGDVASRLKERSMYDELLHLMGCSYILGPRALQCQSTTQVCCLDTSERVLGDGTRYIGGWIDGCRHGHGEELRPDGSRYEGQWANDKAEGHGKLRQVDGDYYEGMWREDNAHGEGKYQQQGVSTFSGQWVAGKRHGSGSEVWVDGRRYHGQYRNGVKSGVGEFLWLDGSRYHGQFVADDLQGDGEYGWPDGRVYCGQWVSRRMHGAGSFQWPDGRTYLGQYLCSKKHGTGVLKWPNGRQYDGQWQSGQRHGTGVSILAGSVPRSGEWDSGRRVCWTDGEDGDSDSTVMDCTEGTLQTV